MDVSKKEKQPGIGTQGPIKKKARVGTQRPSKKEHSQQQADIYEVLLKEVKSARATQCDRAAKRSGADVPEDVPQSENVDERGVTGVTLEVQEGRRMHARSNPKVAAEQQWDAEARGPEHDGAYLEQRTCLK